MSEQQAHYMLDPDEMPAARAETLIELAQDALNDISNALNPLFAMNGDRHQDLQCAKNAAGRLVKQAKELENFVYSLLAEQQPTSNQALDYGGELAKQRKYRSGGQASFENAAGRLQAGEVLHVSNGPGGQMYMIEYYETGSPDVLLTSEITEQQES